MRNRRKILLIAQSALGIGLLLAWLKMVDLSEIGHTLSQAKWPLVFLAAAMMIASTILRLSRWRAILHPLQAVALIELWKVSAVAALVNFLVPLRTAELARSLLLKQRHALPLSVTLPSIAFDRLLDLGAILFVGGVGVVMGVNLNATLRTVLLSGASLLLFAMGAVYVLVRSRSRLLITLARWVPARWGESLQRRMALILGAGMSVFSLGPRRAVRAAGMILSSLAAALLDAGTFYCLFVSLGFTVGPLIVLTGYALFMITFLVPAAPGYVGSMEAFGSLVFTALGVGEAAAASMIVLSHALNVLVLGLTGGLGLALLRTGIEVSIFDLGWSERAPQPAHDAGRMSA